MSRVSNADIEQFINITESDYRTAYYFISHNPGDLNNAIIAYFDIGAEAVPPEFQPPNFNSRPTNSPSQSTARNSNTGDQNSENTSYSMSDDTETSNQHAETTDSPEHSTPQLQISGINLANVFQQVINLLGESADAMLIPPPNLNIPPPLPPPESNETTEENSSKNNEEQEPQQKEELPTFQQYKFQKSTFQKERFYNEKDIEQAFIHLKNESAKVEESDSSLNAEKIYPTFDKNPEILQNLPQNPYQQRLTAKNSSPLKRRYTAKNHTAITLWKNGYSIKGKFTKLDKVKYNEFMNQINSGNIPNNISGDDFEIIDKKSFDFSS
ncbi:hypothetical protein TVAG_278190 [Trichomonas vaginalis G3]|uniref:SEP domain-containing protein n=1 Tax=Trichomonas vaginalis (strain ATCC PRA-98 / G3) TaxID=412133 RepID=A2DU60_TRIV3|nr:UBA-like domain family [Trichomonas vaginalis G3]EAY16053.1 hypothetical protein TVAG_278190 [Trichomonas vaginalis G3]KAI5537282.1 UBA-like domain family [Trichomonas vaginalis G3]|eukprot:XP_001328276.1 hypothetical protein [Trichomonas vaginalis G3]